MQEQRGGRYVERGSEYYRSAPPQPTQTSSEPGKKPRVLKRGKKRAWGALAVLALLIVATAAALFMLTKDNSPLPGSIAQQVTFPVYLPDDSNGVTINQKSYSFQEGALTFTATTPDKSQVFVSEQNVPKNFDLTTFLQHIKNKQTVTNKYGQGNAGVSENNLIISQVNGNTWVFMSGSVKMEPTQLTLVFQSLQKH